MYQDAFQRANRRLASHYAECFQCLLKCQRVNPDHDVPKNLKQEKKLYVCLRYSRTLIFPILSGTFLYSKETLLIWI